MNKPKYNLGDKIVCLTDIPGIEKYIEVIEVEKIRCLADENFSWVYNYQYYENKDTNLHYVLCKLEELKDFDLSCI